MDKLSHLHLILDNTILDLTVDDENSSIKLNSIPTNSPDNSVPSVDISNDLIHNLNSHEIYVIDSINSGKKKEFNFYDEVLEPVLKQTGIDFTYLLTKTSDSIQEFANLIKNNTSNESKILILFLSGDTVMFEFINFFYNLFPEIKSIPKTCILPFPHGTGNALANSSHHFNNLNSLHSLFNFNPIHLPIYQVESTTQLISINKSLSSFTNNPKILFLVVGSWGLHSTLVYESDKSEMREKYGSERFKIAATQILEKNPSFRGSINQHENSYIFDNTSQKWITKNDIESQDLSYFLLTAVSNLEETFQISPDSKIEEDSLSLVAIPHVDSNKVMKLMYDAYDHGNHINDTLVLYKHDKTFSLYIDDSNPEQSSIICLDGSLWKVTNKNRNLKFSTLPQSFLHILV